MPRTRSLAWSELKIGLVSVVALVLAGAMIFLLSGRAASSGSATRSRRSSPTSRGWVGAPVRVAGLEVGTVEDVRFVGDRVEIVMQVNKTQQPRITNMSTASLGSVSLLGEAAVDITPVSKGTPIPEFGYVPAAPAPSNITDLTNQASVGITELTALITDIRADAGPSASCSPTTSSIAN
jgi:phospholipid/cholesterol/gamma-HCH transport system substrate-binding protein